MTDELEGIWNEAVMTALTYYLGTWKNHEKSQPEKSVSGRDSNREPALLLDHFFRCWGSIVDGWNVCGLIILMEKYAKNTAQGKSHSSVTYTEWAPFCFNKSGALITKMTLEKLYHTRFLFLSLCACACVRERAKHMNVRHITQFQIDQKTFFNYTLLFTDKLFSHYGSQKLWEH
jgi:hypothetical protein